VKDPRQIAIDLVEEITDTVFQRFNPRRGVLVPPRLMGRCAVASAKAGETVMDRADVLLDAASEEWPVELEPDVYLDLVQDKGHWQVEWVVDTVVEDDSAASEDDSAASEDDSAASEEV
jgi:hypothetical protein